MNENNIIIRRFWVTDGATIQLEKPSMLLSMYAVIQQNSKRYLARLLGYTMKDQNNNYAYPFLNNTYGVLGAGLVEDVILGHTFEPVTNIKHRSKTDFYITSLTNDTGKHMWVDIAYLTY